MPLSEVDEYAETLLARQLSTIDGVAQVNVYGSQKYAVRIQADPAALAARRIGIDQLVARGRQTPMSTMATGALNGPHQSTVIHTERPAQQRRRIQQPDHRLPERRAGAAADVGRVPSTAWRTTYVRELVQRQARHRAGDPAPARLQHHRGGRRDQEACCRSSRRSLPPSVKLDVRLRPQPDRSAPRSTTCRPRC